MNNTEEEIKGNPWIIILLFFVVISVIAVIIWIQIPHHPEEDYLQDRIDSMEDVSDIYRQGWNDCIDALRYFNRMARNATGSLT